MKALLVVDVQNDFLPGGALPVPEGDEVIPVANRLMPKFPLVVATRDWHPANHGSFAVAHPGKSPGDVVELDGLQQVLWPVHCVESTPGAQFPDSLETRYIRHVISKGTDPRVDSYSGFFDNARRRATGLVAYLKQNGVRQVFVLGLALDYCVRATALDAADLGYETHLVEDGTRAVNLQPTDGAKAVMEMREAGVRMVRSIELE